MKFSVYIETPKGESFGWDEIGEFARIDASYSLADWCNKNHFEVVSERITGYGLHVVVDKPVLVG